MVTRKKKQQETQEKSVNSKNKKSNTEKKKTSSKKKKSANRKKRVFRTPVQSTQQNIPIRDLYDGIVITKDRRYVKIIEIKPITFLLLSPKEQGKVCDGFARVLKSSPVNIQLTCVSLPADLNVQLNKLDADIMTEENASCRTVDYEYRAKLIASQRYGVTRRFFITLEYEQSGFIFNQPPIDNIVNWLNTAAQRVESYIAACGNEIVRMDPRNPNYYTAEILYTLLNRSKYVSEPFDRHLQSVFNRYFEHYGTKDYYLPPTDFLAPDTMSFVDKKYCVINGLYYSFAYITSEGYNPSVTGGWLTPFINSYVGVDLNIYLRKISKEAVQNDIRKNLTYSKVASTENADTTEAFESISSTLSAGYYYRNGLNAGEDFYDMAVLLTVSGESPEIVDAKMTELKKLARSSDIIFHDCTYEMEEAFISSLPLAKLDDKIWKKAKRNTLTSGASSTYPFTAFELNDDDGIYVGDDLTNGSLVSLDIFNAKRFNNANMFICGQTGAGKTYTLLLLAIRMRIKHIPVYILAPEKEHEFRRICNALGGQFIQIAGGSPDRINVMEIYKKDEKALLNAALIDGEHAQLSYLAEKVRNLKEFFSLLVTDISIEEKQLLDSAIVNVYAKYGITNDNNSLYDPNDPTRSKFRKMPIISDLVDELKANPRTLRMGNIISILATGSGNSFNGETNVVLDNPFTVIGVEHLEGDMMPLGIYMAMDFLWSKIKEDRTRKKVLFIDEWWKLAYNPIAAAYSMEIARVIRAYRGSIVFATQQMTDILAIDNGQFGSKVLNNCRIKILMKMEENDANEVQNIVNLSSNERDSLIKFERGEALLLAGTNKLSLKFVASETEHKLITTTGDDLEALIGEAIRKENEMKEPVKEEKPENIDAPPVFNDVVDVYSADEIIDVIAE